MICYINTNLCLFDLDQFHAKMIVTVLAGISMVLISKQILDGLSH